jgi:hypothetical protein
MAICITGLYGYDGKKTGDWKKSPKSRLATEAKAEFI